jgi:hypothetical protein
MKTLAAAFVHLVDERERPYATAWWISPHFETRILRQEERAERA